MINIFFDIDETLLNQRKSEVYASSCFLDVFGKSLPHHYSVTQFCQLWRFLREKHARLFLENSITFDEQRRRRIRDLFDQPSLSKEESESRFSIYSEAYQRAWSLFDDVLPCLEALQNYRLGIISNGSTQQQKRKLKLMRIHDRFEVIVISEMFGVPKPKREIFEAACRKAKCSTDASIYIGDRPEMDAKASCDAGMRGIWLNRYRVEGPRDLEEIHSLNELPDKILNQECFSSSAES
jgi:putative hydrolase of the HAD superfamily